MDPRMMRQDEVVLFQFRIPPGGSLSLVQDADGLTIRRNDRVLTGCFYSDVDLDRAIEEFTTIARELGGTSEG